MKKIACLSLVMVIFLAMPVFGGEYRVRLEQPFKGSPDPQVANWYLILDLSGRRIGYMTPCYPDQEIWDIRIDDDIDWNAFPDLPPKAAKSPHSDPGR